MAERNGFYGTSAVFFVDPASSVAVSILPSLGGTGGIDDARALLLARVLERMERKMLVAPLRLLLIGAKKLAR